MAILTRSGRAALAAAIKALPIHVALGTGDPDWNSSRSGVFAFGGDETLTLPHVPVAGAVVRTPDGSVTFVAGQDYSIEAATGLVRRLPDGAIAAAASVAIDYQVGRPPEDVAQTALRGEVGRRLAEEVAFVVPATEGAIVVPSGRYDLSEDPTNHLMVRVRFDFADAATAVVREEAVFVGTVTEPDLPPGQRFFTPDQVVEPGILLLLQHSVPIVRQPSTRETFEFVITF